MNKNSKKKYSIFLKVFLAHLIVIVLLDVNLSKIIEKDSKNFKLENNAKFVNLKSISLEEIERKRKKLEALKKKKLAEEKKKKLEALKKKKLAEEKKKKLAEEKKKKLAEEKKQNELEKLKQDELKELANYEINKLEKELLEIERIESLIKLQNIRNAQLTDSEQRYILTIKAKIENNWLIPHNTKHDKICTAIVNQLPSGKVTSVTIHGCKGDSIYIDSLVNAVWKSSPLPVAPDIEVFQENIVLQFEEPN